MMAEALDPDSMLQLWGFVARGSLRDIRVYEVDICDSTRSHVRIVGYVGFIEKCPPEEFE